MHELNESRLFNLLSIPTAPFREENVKRHIKRVLTDGRVPFFEDKTGNILLGARSKSDYWSLLKSKDPEPLRVFIAHLDHPGVQGLEWLSENELSVEWLGGSPTEHLEGAQISLFNSLGHEFKGTLTRPEMASHGRALAKGVVRVGPDFPKKTKAQEWAGYLSFRAPIWEENGILYSKCCDDLIGIYAIIELALQQKWDGKKRPPFVALLSRAEEVGFIGAIGHFEEGYLKPGKRPRFVVSLETSRTLPGADLGKGPILRLGDRMNVFDSGLTKWMIDTIESKFPGQGQRRVMDGGSCEASAALAYGLRTIAFSVPLGNYHNQSFQGGPDAAPTNGPAPEFVHRSDVEKLQAFIELIVKTKCPIADPYKSIRKKFKDSLKAMKNRL